MPTTFPQSFGPLDEANFNQVPLFEGVDLYARDRPLQEAVTRAGANLQSLAEFGQSWGRAEVFEDARLANEHLPNLRTVDPMGRRIDRVDFHPSYHALMARSMAAGLHCSVWDQQSEPSAHAARAARVYMASGVEAGHMCPITMTNAAVASLQCAPELLAAMLPKILSRTYDPSSRPWWEKTSMTLGMGMTERQGGSDVRANISDATHHGDHALVTGHKWFMSAPMCDAFLVLAQAAPGLGCYLIPRYRPDGSLNTLRFQRLKSKLGNKSNASSEVEFLQAYAHPLGAPGQGVKTIIEMVSLTRLDCAVSAAGLMRMALAHALHHVSHRFAFQKRLIDQPAMRAVLADMALELEGATALALRLATAFDKARIDEHENAVTRLLTPVVKYALCKRVPALVYEAMECHGGNGYVEELPLARLYREAPLNAIWEGSGNIMALDLLRAIARQPDAARQVIERLVRAGSPSIDAKTTMAELEPLLSPHSGERGARALIERLAKLATLSTLADARSPATETYAATRLAGAPRDFFGAAQIAPAIEERLLARAWAH